MTEDQILTRMYELSVENSGKMSEMMKISKRHNALLTALIAITIFSNFSNGQLDFNSIINSMKLFGIFAGLVVAVKYWDFRGGDYRGGIKFATGSLLVALSIILTAPILYVILSPIDIILLYIGLK